MYEKDAGKKPELPVNEKILQPMEPPPPAGTYVKPPPPAVLGGPPPPPPPPPPGKCKTSKIMSWLTRKGPNCTLTIF